MINTKSLLSLLMFLTFYACQPEKPKTPNNEEAKADSTKSAPKVGGTFYMNLISVPTTLNPLTSTDGYATRVAAYILEGLLTVDPDTREWQPNLAKEWNISSDGLTFTFTLREDVQWSDGKKMTAEDVKYSFDVIRSGEYQTARIRPYFENFISAKIIAPFKIQFKANKKYFGNFTVLASGGFMPIVPKHVYHKPSEEKRKELNKTLIGSGPYTLENFDRKKAIILKRNPKWWGWDDPYQKGLYNFERIFMRFIKEENIALEMLKKGKIDFDGLSPEIYQKKAVGPGWGSKWIKKKVQNKSVKGYSFIGWNQQHPILKNKNVRKALGMLLNRQKMNTVYNYNLSLLTTGPLYRQSPYVDPAVKPLTYDPDAALALLRSEGWSDSDKDQILDKVIDGKKTNLAITILEPSKDFVKYLSMYQEDARKVGVDLNIKLIEWNAFVKLIDEKEFEAVRLAWGGGSLDWDPKQVWHSTSSKGGSNFINYHNPEVDRLIDMGREIMERKERIPVFRKVFRLIAEDYPYTFLFNRDYELYMLTKRVEQPKETFVYTIGEDYWWLEK